MTSGFSTVYERKYSTNRRRDFVQERRKIRRDAKLIYFNTNPSAQQAALLSANRVGAVFDCLQVPGGPLIVPCAFDYKYYDGSDLLDLIEDGFYDDYDPIDCLDI